MNYAIVNTGDSPLTMIDLGGNAHPFTVGLSIYTGETSDEVDGFIEMVEGISCVPLTSLKALSISAFKKLVNGPITIASLKTLLSSDFLKVGQIAALKEVAENASIKV